MYHTGELTERVKILRDSDTDDGMGGTEGTPVEIAEVWAHVRPLSGGESNQQQQQTATSKYLIVVRNGLNLLDTDTLEWQGEQFNIQFRKQPKARNPFLEIEAERGVAT